MFTAIVDFMNISIIIPNWLLTGNCLKFIGHVLLSVYVKICSKEHNVV